jgi:hypothetical protein
LQSRFTLPGVHARPRSALADGWYIGTSPIITANWLTTGDKAWTLPIGANVGRVVKIGKLPVNFLLGAYYNALRPEFGANRQLRAQVTFIF